MIVASLLVLSLSSSLSESPRSATLVSAQAFVGQSALGVVLPVQSVLGQTADVSTLRKRLTEVIQELRRTEDGWGGVNLALAIAGFTLSAALLPGLVLTLGGIFGIEFLIVGLICLAVGAGGLVMGIIGATQGIRNQNDVKDTRFRLNKEKRELEEQIAAAEQMSAPPPPPPPSSRLLPDPLYLAYR